MGNRNQPDSTRRKVPVPRTGLSRDFCAVLACLVLSSSISSANTEGDRENNGAEFSGGEAAVHETISKEDRNRIVLTSTAVGVGAVTVWGVLNWDYFSSRPSCGSERWFGENTENGGVDKLGHLYTSYVFSHGLACFYEYCNFDRNAAALYGSLTTCAIMG